VSSSSPTDDQKRQILSALEDRRDELDELDMAIAGETVGVYQTLDRIREALNVIEGQLDDRDLSALSQIGFGAISTEFVTLQRMLASVGALDNRITVLAQEVALETTKITDQVMPEVKGALSNLKAKDQRED